MGTRSYFGLVAVVAAVAMAMACNSPRRGGGGGGGGDVDAGDDTTPDGGAGDTDSGGIMIMDSGMTGTDSGTPPECTTSGDCATGEECIEGSCETVSMSCPTNIVPTTGPSCAASTGSCWDECAGDSTCQQGCLDADPSADACNACVNQNLISCINDNGCQEQWNCFNQCFEDNGCTDRACVEANCGPEDTAYNDCVESLPSSVDCSAEFSMCFSTT